MRCTLWSLVMQYMADNVTIMSLLLLGYWGSGLPQAWQYHLGETPSPGSGILIAPCCRVCGLWVLGRLGDKGHLAYHVACWRRAQSPNKRAVRVDTYCLYKCHYVSGYFLNLKTNIYHSTKLRNEGLYIEHFTKGDYENMLKYAFSRTKKLISISIFCT